MRDTDAINNEIVVKEKELRDATVTQDDLDARIVAVEKAFVELSNQQKDIAVKKGNLELDLLTLNSSMKMSRNIIKRIQSELRSLDKEYWAGKKN
jgi:hypothetical protein